MPNLNPEALEAIFGAIEEEFAEPAHRVPLGVVSTCFLGEPKEVHTIDHAARIIEHYSPSEPLPSGLESARKLARYAEYLCIEVYSDTLVAVHRDGTTTEVKR